MLWRAVDRIDAAAFGDGSPIHDVEAVAEKAHGPKVVRDEQVADLSLALDVGV